VRLDLRIDNANVLTMDPAHPLAGSIGVWNGLVAALDGDAAALPARRVADAGGATVLPGFVDAHTHLCWAGLEAGAADISGGSSIDEVLATISVAATAAPTGGWVDVAGYDQRLLGRHLTAADLDRVGQGRPVYVQHRSGHACVVSSDVLARLPDGWLTPGREGVDIGADGQPTGVLAEQAMLGVRDLRVPYALTTIVDAIERTARVCLAQGVTMCAEAGIGTGLLGHSPVELAAYQAAVEQGRLAVRAQVMVASDVLHDVTANAADGLRRGVDLGLRTGLGDRRLSIGALKIYTDGGMMARTAALTEPYNPQSGNPGSGNPGSGNSGSGNSGPNCGLLQREPAELIATMVDGHGAGWQLAVHAIGDRALDVALDGIEQAQRGRPRPEARHRVEHAGLVRPDQLRRMARLGVTAVIQPTFLYAYGDDYAAILGPERAGFLYRGRGFLDAGVRIAGSSDRPVADGAPLRAIAFMTDRRSCSGQVIGPGEELTVTEALEAYTVQAAWACGAERWAGSITPGKAADFVVLGEDPRRLPPDRIPDIEIRATVVGGEVAYGAL
jgi:predicted amidohydrolase YtcJ